MGGNIPLPALALNPQQSQDPLAQIKNVLAIRNQQQQGQLQQQAVQEGQINLQDTQNMRNLAPQFVQKDESGKVTGFDNEGYYNALRGAGVSPAKVATMQNTIATATKNLADAGAAEQALHEKKNNNLYQIYEGVRDTASDPTADVSKVNAAYQSALPQLRSLGVDISKFPAQFTTTGQAIDAIKSFEIPLGMHKQQIEDSKDIATTNKDVAQTGEAVTGSQKNVAQAGEATAATAKTNIETDALKQMGGLTPQLAEAKYLKLQQLKNMGVNIPAEDQAFVKAYEHQKTLVPVANFNLQNAGAAGSDGKPSAIVQAIADGSMKWSDAVSPRTPMSIKQQTLAEVKKLNPNFNSGDFAVEQAVKTEATSGAVGKQLLAIGTAREHMKLFGKLADALANNDTQALNKIGNYFGVQFGSDKKTNFDIASQAFGGEVGKAFDGAGVVAGEREQAQKNFNAQMSKGQFRGAIQTVDALLAGKQKAAHSWFDAGTKAQPDFGQGSAQPQGKTKENDPLGIR